MSDGSRPLRIAAALVGAQGVALVLISVVYAGSLVVGSPHNRGLALFGALLGLLGGVGLVLAARGVAHRRRASYAPVLLTEVIAVPVGIGLIQGGLPLIAVAVLAPAAVVLAMLLGTPAGRALHSVE
jgi:hypothetical protein